MKPHLRKWFEAAMVAWMVLLLSACDMAASVKEAMALSEQAAQAIDQQVGDKPQIGFTYKNNKLLSVSVLFQKAPALTLNELEQIARKEVRSAFKSEPTNLVLSFNFPSQEK